MTENISDVKDFERATEIEMKTRMPLGGRMVFSLTDSFDHYKHWRVQVCEVCLSGSGYTRLKICG
jgi:hypothetical protein